MTKVENENSDSVGLKRELGLFSAVSLIVSVMIGSGIFVSPADALKNSGSIGFCLIVWIVCGCLSLLCALTYAELSSVVPRSGAEYTYALEAFSPLHRWFGQVPAFLISWVNVLIIRPAQVAVVIMTCSEYLVAPFATHLTYLSDTQMELVKRFISFLGIGLITYINVSSVKLYIKIQNVFGLCKIAACVLVIGGGLYWLGSGNTELLTNLFEDTTTSVGSIALAFYYGLWAYEGWNVAALVTEEVQKPEVNILRSILIAVPIVTILYVAMNLMYMSGLSITEMVEAQAVAVTWAEKVLPSWLGFAIPVGVALSCFGTCLSVQFGVSRICYVAGSEGHLPRFFGFIHMVKMTPVTAVALQGLLSFLYVAMGNIKVLIELCSFLMWASYGSAMAALLVLRKIKPNANRPYRVPTFVPWLVLFMAIFLAIMPIITNPSLKYLFAVALLVIGVLLYHFYVYQKRSSVICKRLTHLMQALCLVVEPDKSEAEVD